MSPGGAALDHSSSCACSDAAGFEVSLACILAPEGWATNGSRASGKQVVHKVIDTV
ncbi:hypothetical protein DPMN_171632 [Dreissena polymorpha]|uniref:Uncharacterized protein n=1 Tax=Dreissena polymorpha TaxID=45954 RepID=A0A9D4IFB9_DREPO|nr:hypothetical protein DPMN_171632 [Dreissena polymorpha]